MKKERIGIMIMLVLAMGGVLGYYAGESFSITLPQDYDYYSIVGNSTLIDLDIIQDGLNLTITFDKYQQGDTFEMIFFDNNINETEKIVYRGDGGGTRTKYVDKNVTVYTTEYVDRNITTEVEVEKIINSIEYIEEPNNYYYILFALVLGGILMWVILRFFGNEEEYEEEKYEYDDEE